MLNTLKTHIVLPLLGRLGTATATVLVGYGMQADPAHQIGAFVVAGAGIVYDLIADYLQRRFVMEKTLTAIFPGRE